jgi:proteic killer suppression protein
VISRYRDKRTERFANRQHVPAFSGFAKKAAIKLRVVESARSLSTLSNLPGNRLEALKGDRVGQYSIRINDQWRLCFEWSDEASMAVNIEIVDYH